MNTRDKLLNQIKHGTTSKLEYDGMEFQLRTPKHTDLLAYQSEDDEIRTAAGIRIIIDCVKDADGKPVFEATDAVWLKEDRSPLTDYLFTEIIKLRIRMIEAIEDKEKN